LVSKHKSNRETQPNYQISSYQDRLGREFFARPATAVAEELLGTLLIRRINDTFLVGRIVEAEAYCDGDLPDLACHGDRANGGKPTDRTRVMFGPPGHAYVYFTYGMHWMFNIVTGKEGQANAVLIRALEPLSGRSMMAQNRKNLPLSQLTNGPAKLAQALEIDKSLNGANLCSENSVIWLEDNRRQQGFTICTGPRVGLGKTPEPWLSILWRFWIEDNPFVSK